MAVVTPGAIFTVLGLLSAAAGIKETVTHYNRYKEDGTLPFDDLEESAKIHVGSQPVGGPLVDAAQGRRKWGDAGIEAGISAAAIATGPLGQAALGPVAAAAPLASGIAGAAPAAGAGLGAGLTAASNAAGGVLAMPGTLGAGLAGGAAGGVGAGAALAPVANLGTQAAQAGAATIGRIGEAGGAIAIDVAKAGTQAGEAVTAQNLENLVQPQSVLNVPVQGPMEALPDVRGLLQKAQDLYAVPFNKLGEITTPEVGKFAGRVTTKGLAGAAGNPDDPGRGAMVNAGTSIITGAGGALGGGLADSAFGQESVGTKLPVNNISHSYMAGQQVGSQVTGRAANKLLMDATAPAPERPQAFQPADLMQTHRMMYSGTNPQVEQYSPFRQRRLM